MQEEEKVRLKKTKDEKRKTEAVVWKLLVLASCQEVAPVCPHSCASFLQDLSHHCCHHLIGEFSFLSLTFYPSSSFCLWLSEELEDLTTHCLLISTDHDVQVCWLVFVEDDMEVLKVEYPQVDPRLDHLLDELHWEHQVHLGLLIGTDHVVLVLLLVPVVAKLEVVLEDHLEEDLRVHLQENRPWEHLVRLGLLILTDHVV